MSAHFVAEADRQIASAQLNGGRQFNWSHPVYDALKGQLIFGAMKARPLCLGSLSRTRDHRDVRQ